MRTNVKTWDVARACHEAIRKFCAMNADDSIPGWLDAADWQRQASYDMVVWIVENPDAPDSAIHDQWMRDKKAKGWTWGPIKSDKAKTHPCLLPFRHLPWAQQEKDRVFKRTCLSEMSAAK